MSYIGSTPTTQSFISGTDYFNGDGSTTAFTLTRTVNSVNDIEVVINNVVQQPNTAYTISGTTVTFTSAPSSGTSNIYVRYLSTTTQSITPSQNTVSYSTLNSDNQSKLGISFKNRIINGAMVVAQYGTSVTVNDAAAFYAMDRWECQGASGDGVYTVAQSSTAPVGFASSLLATVTTADSSLGATQSYSIRQKIEGYNIADLGFGTANAKTVTVSFWVRSSLTGTFGGALINGGFSRSYPFTYTISAADTWEQKSVTIAGDTTGTWTTDNTLGMTVTFALGQGSSRLGTAGAWVAANNQGATGQTQIISTVGATFYLTGVQLEVGTQATTFDYRSIGTELALCQRYFEKSYELTTAPATNTGTAEVQSYGVSDGTSNSVTQRPFLVSKRASPTMTYYTESGTSGQWQYQRSGATGTGTMSNYTTSQNQWAGYIGIGATWVSCFAYGHWTASAEL